MHKETVNTFTKGMVKDTHPLTTPADVLTDCLNGTLITYNGNEMILQNDMGNVLIGSAELPAGYIPVGITEYGGIIYVASYNPETKKGQIGSFPSPLQVHLSEIWSVNVSPSDTIENIFNSDSFYNGSDIVRTEIKYNLGYVLDGDDYIIHTGDKIKIQNVPVNTYIETLFAVLKKDGSLEIVDGNYLDGNEHVYTGKSSGVPILIVKLLTLKSFSLEREYSRGTPLNNEDTVTITFTGKFEEEKEGVNSLPVLGHGIGGNYTTGTNPSTLYIIENLPMSGTYTLDFIPILNLGNLISMKKSVSIDLDKFKKDTYELTNWSYYVTDSYIKINWSFDYYTLDTAKEIKKIAFKFYPISLIDSNSYIYEIEKESYNGSFEEIINFNDTFTKNNIYLVKIVGNTDTHLGNRLLYTSGIFNDYYGRVKDFTNKGFLHDLPEVMWNPGSNSLSNDPWENAYRKDLVVSILPDILVTNDSITNNITITNPLGLETYFSKKSVSGGSFITTSEDRGTGYYNISIKNRYNFIVNLKAEPKEDSKIVGSLTNETIQALLSSFNKSKLNFNDNSQKSGTLRVTNEFSTILDEFSNNTLGSYHAGELYNTGFLSYGQEFNEDQEEEPTEETEQEELEIQTGIVIESKILAKASSVYNKEVQRIGLAPLYYNDLDATTKDKVFTGWNVNKPLFATGADENNYHYNATLAGTTIVAGTNTGAGCDDTGLCTAMEQMGQPMVSMSAGVDGDEASYSPEGSPIDFTLADSYLQRRNVAGWNCGSNEIDGTDDFLIATWKLSDGKYRFSVLASHRQHNPSGRLARLDYMIRSLLSLLFTKLNYKYNLRYITVNPEEYGYYNPLINVQIDLLTNDNVNYNVVTHILEQEELEQTNYDVAINNHMIYTYLLLDKYSEDENAENLNGIKDDEIMLVKYDIIPEIGNNEKLFTGDSFTEELGNLLTGATYSSLILGDDKSSEKWIYVPDWTKIEQSDSIYEVTSDGTINWLVNDMTPYLKLSGTPDGSGYVYVDDEGVNRVSLDGDNFGDDDPAFGILVPNPENNFLDPLSTTGPASRNVNIISNPVSGPIGDVLRWNGHEWPFYHSFLHMFMTRCAMNDESLREGVYNEIVVNRNEGYAGSWNSTGMWRNNKDENAPDMFACLGNSYNSIYGRYYDPSTSSIN